MATPPKKPDDKDTGKPARKPAKRGAKPSTKSETGKPSTVATQPTETKLSAAKATKASTASAKSAALSPEDTTQAEAVEGATAENSEISVGPRRPARRRRPRPKQRVFDVSITQEAAQGAGLWVQPNEEQAATDMPAALAAPTSAISDAQALAAGLFALEPARRVRPARRRRARRPQTAKPHGNQWVWLDKVAGHLTTAFTALSQFRAVALVCIALIAVGAFTPGFTTIPPIDRDESRFSQATRQMVATGDYVDIRFQNEPRYQKPIGIYWLQSIAVNLYGAEDGQAPIWVYRTVSFIGAVMAALLVYWLALTFGAPPVAFVAATLVALTILLGAEARLAKTDAMLFAMILMAQGVLAKAFLMKRDSAVRPWQVALFWTATAAGILIKGPILPMVIGTTAIATSLMERRVGWLRRLRPGYGLFWLAILAVPWFVAIGIRSGGDFYAQSIGADLLEKIGQSRERPFVPPGAFVFGFFPTLGWPMAPLAFLAIPFAIATWRDRTTRFLIAWIVPTWLIFELSATKLPHYILPIYPALAILAARMVVYEKLPKGILAGLAKVLFILVPVAAMVGMPAILNFYGDGVDPVGTTIGAVGALVLIFAWALMLRSHARASFMMTIVGTLAVYWAAFGYHVPAARTIWITPALVASLDAVDCERPQLMTMGYNEPSLVLMTRTDMRMATDPSVVAAFLVGGGCRAAFVDGPGVEAVFESLAGLVDVEADNQAAIDSVRLVARVEGININGGDELNMHVLAAGERAVLRRSLQPAAEPSASTSP